jgi:phosphoserine phosphatase RsbX
MSWSASASDAEMAEGNDRQLLDWGIARRSRPGEAACGDVGVVSFFPGGALVAAVDGLGHGAEAARAADTAAEVVRSLGGQSLVALVGRCHDALGQTRGVAMSVASYSASAETMTWLGIGNVEGRLVTVGSPASRSLRLQSGLTGHELPALAPATVRIRRGDVLLFATDGIEPAFADTLDSSGSAQEIADRVFAEHWKARDDALVLVSRYLGVPS